MDFCLELSHSSVHTLVDMLYAGPLGCVRSNLIHVQ